MSTTSLSWGCRSTGTCVDEPTSEDADLALARELQAGLRALARHSAHYASVLADRRGVRLAGHVVAGDVADLSPRGRDAMLDAHSHVQRALSVDPGLDTNQLIDRLTGRRDPRLDRVVSRDVA